MISLRFTTVAKLQSWLGVITAWGTVLKGCSTGKIESRCARPWRCLCLWQNYAEENWADQKTSAEIIYFIARNVQLPAFLAGTGLPTAQRPCSRTIRHCFSPELYDWPSAYHPAHLAWPFLTKKLLWFLSSSSSVCTVDYFLLPAINAQTPSHTIVFSSIMFSVHLN